jgi:hypothetical protein
VSGRPTATLSLPAEAIEDHLAAVAWDRVNADLDEKGFAIIEALLNTAECRSVAGLYGVTVAFAAVSSWQGMALAVANTNISPILCPRSSPA